MKLGSILIGIGISCAAGLAGAAGGSDAPSSNWSSTGKADDAVLKAAKAALAAGDYGAAQAALKPALASDPGNADLHNLYAYALRKAANPDMALVFKHYNEALRIDPKHRGAHEYIGEAYLMTGNLPKAREHLAALDRICFFGCAELDELKKAVAAYESRPK